MIKKFKFVVLIPCLLLIFLYSNKSFALELDLANYPTPYQIINNGGMDVYYVSGTDGTLNYECEKQCGELVSANIGTKVVGDGGFYYNYLDTPNENGVKGLFFPAYFSCTDGSYVGCAPSYPDYESVKPRIIEPTAADKKRMKTSLQQ